MVSGQDRSKSGRYPVLGVVAEFAKVVQSRVDADEVAGRHADATVGNRLAVRPTHEARVAPIETHVLNET